MGRRHGEAAARGNAAAKVRARSAAPAEALRARKGRAAAAAGTGAGDGSPAPLATGAAGAAIPARFAPICDPARQEPCALANPGAVVIFHATNFLRFSLKL
ncbi:MAG: hypothetical protein KID09_21795 [Paenibacillus macerans]|uniref:hypothetical protein n=4 Tax=Paenibacillus macerans TaxID=44252 RepID=UPI00242AC747|nr:hypothetical protein [Paenibacillus macerans]MBS5913220.1 hypothetical protein [Paenibacillus macerans]MDU5951117.1 hypothetical protein [Paenibacillus macerans]